MKKMLITGGTVFVSRYAAEYFAEKYDVYVLNRNTRTQSRKVTLIKADRHALGEKIKKDHFDVVLDVTAYNEEDITDLLNGLGSFDAYIMVSSSAVYPESGLQPFREDAELGKNKFWGKYGLDKIAAEKNLLSRVPEAYILRPPYLYGPMNNVYREAFAFDCAKQNRPFYLPGDGSMKLQFFHVEDLCRFVEKLLEMHPEQHIFNVGNPESVTIKEWVERCYSAAGVLPKFVSVPHETEQRAYFPFYNYEYYLDVKGQSLLLPETKEMKIGLLESLNWYLDNEDKVMKKPLISYIDEKIK